MSTFVVRASQPVETCKASHIKHSVTCKRELALNELVTFSIDLNLNSSSFNFHLHLALSYGRNVICQLVGALSPCLYSSCLSKRLPDTS
jgi:hypothetical protein